MKGEISRDLFCSTAGVSDCPEKGNCSGCPDYHRKWPTLEQFKEEYGEEVPQGMPIWIKIEDYPKWILIKMDTEHLSPSGSVFYWCASSHTVNAIVVACTPWGKPPTDWRPE